MIDIAKMIREVTVDHIYYQVRRGTALLTLLRKVETICRGWPGVLDPQGCTPRDRSDLCVSRALEPMST